MKQTLPGFSVAGFAVETQDISSLQLAATIFAMDVPLCKNNGWTVQAGDGIKGNRVTFHFTKGNNQLYSASSISDSWNDPKFIAENANHPVSVCKRAFDFLYDFTKIAKRSKPGNLFHGKTDSIKVTNTRKAAALAAMKNPMMGIRWSGPCCIFHFPMSAKVDFDLYDRETLYSELPTHALSYVKAALLSHEAMLKLSEDAEFARVNHRKKTAIIGKEVSKEKLNIIDKLLYQKR